MNRRSLLGFIVLNVVVTFITVFGVFSLLQRITPQATLPISQPLFVVVTATQDPKGPPVSYVIVTATPGPNAPGEVPSAAPLAQGTLAAQPGAPTTSANATSTAQVGGIPTLDPSLLPPNLGTPGAVGAALNGSQGTDQAQPGACQSYTIKRGDTAGNIAATFGVSLDDLMRANKLKESDLVRLQIDQVLIIPINGCGLATEAATATDTPTKINFPTPQPSVTLAPTATQARIEIAQVISPGDIAAEGIEIRNVSSGVIRMQGWTISDANGLKFTFPDYQLFPKGRVTVFTRAGANTPVVLYWGQAKALWGDPTQQITIADDQGVIQVTHSFENGATGSIQNDTGSTVPTPTAGG